MRLEEFESNLKRRKERKGLQYVLNPGASAELIRNAENRLGELPDQIRQFYDYFNGLSINNSTFRVLPIEELKRDKSGKIPFCTFDGGIITLSFDASIRNAANQWTIENYATSYVVTLTMASFWTNKIIGWLDRDRRIWEPEEYT